MNATLTGTNTGDCQLQSNFPTKPLIVLDSVPDFLMRSYLRGKFVLRHKGKTRRQGISFLDPMKPKRRADLGFRVYGKRIELLDRPLVLGQPVLDVQRYFDSIRRIGMSSALRMRLVGGHERQELVD